MNIKQLDAFIEYEDVFRDYEFYENMSTLDRHKENYFNKFSSYMNHRGMKLFFKNNESYFINFIKINFIKFPVHFFNNDTKYKKLLNRLFVENFEYFHSKDLYLFKLLTLYQIPEPILNMYDELIPEYFNPRSKNFRKFLFLLFHYQKLPNKIFYKYSKYLKNDIYLAKALISSKQYVYYNDKIFNSNRQLFANLKNLIDHSMSLI